MDWQLEGECRIVYVDNACWKSDCCVVEPVENSELDNERDDGSSEAGLTTPSLA